MTRPTVSDRLALTVENTFHPKGKYIDRFLSYLPYSGEAAPNEAPWGSFWFDIVKSVPGSHGGAAMILSCGQGMAHRVMREHEDNRAKQGVSQEPSLVSSTCSHAR